VGRELKKVVSENFTPQNLARSVAERDSQDRGKACPRPEISLMKKTSGSPPSRGTAAGNRRIPANKRRTSVLVEGGFMNPL
jgi:hypothetical protein